MRASVRDSGVLCAIRPLELTAYLRVSGWTQAAVKAEVMAQWLRRDGNDEYAVDVPLNANIRDYAARIADVLAVLEVTEQRSQLEIVRDLNVTGADVLRVRLKAPESSDGTLNLLEGVGAYGRTWELMMAGACSAVRPKAWYRTRKPQKAEEYVRGLRLGQSDLGSYVITVHSKVPPLLQNATPGESAVEQPFERHAMTHLSMALHVARQAADQAASAGGMNSFQDSIARGVSANLCDAIAGMTERDAGIEAVRFEFSWSRTRPQALPAQNRIEFSADSIAVIAEAGRVLRETAPLEDAEVRGLVVRLDWPADAETGTATILGSVEGLAWQVNVKVVLSQADRALARDAWESRREVSFQADIVREGKAYSAKTIRDFSYAAEA